MRPNRAWSPFSLMARDGNFSGLPAPSSRRRRRLLMEPPCCRQGPLGGRVTLGATGTVIPAIPQHLHPFVTTPLYGWIECRHGPRRPSNGSHSPPPDVGWPALGMHLSKSRCWRQSSNRLKRQNLTAVLTAAHHRENLETPPGGGPPAPMDLRRTGQHRRRCGRFCCRSQMPRISAVEPPGRPPKALRCHSKLYVPTTGSPSHARRRSALRA